jgi:hypothetical protein
VPGLVEFIEADEPRLLAFNECANEEGTEVGGDEAMTASRIPRYPALFRCQASARRLASP